MFLPSRLKLASTELNFTTPVSETDFRASNPETEPSFAVSWPLPKTIPTMPPCRFLSP